MKIPYVNAIGLTVHPTGYTARLRRRPLRWRILAALLIVLFGFAVVWTSVVSLGSYCLTSDGGDTRDLPRRRRDGRSGAQQADDAGICGWA